jgi:hypothetical protein
MHGNAKAKHIPMKITMIGRSKKTGSTEYKKVGNSEEEKSPSGSHRNNWTNGGKTYTPF